MFTGIIRHLGTVTKSSGTAEEHELTIETSLAGKLAEGDSIAVNGACMTVLAKTDTDFSIRLMAESIMKTNLANLKKSDHINLELPLSAGDSLDGHFVTGHVDGTAAITTITPAGSDRIFTIQPPANLMRYFVPKGTVALAGTSLTVVDTTASEFTVSIMPYTLEHTTLGTAKPGDTINIEADVLAKHAIAATERYLANQPQPA